MEICVISPKDWEEDSFLILQSQDFVTIKHLEVPSSYFLTIGRAEN